MQDPTNIKLTRTLARTWVFSFATAFSSCTASVAEETYSSKRNRETGNDVQQAEARNGQLRRQNLSLKEEKMPSNFQVGVLYGLPLAPIFETRAEVRSLDLVQSWFFIRYGGRYNTAWLRRIRAMKHTHTHTHTHRGQPTATVSLMLPSTRCCAHAKRLQSLIKEKIALRFLSRPETFNGPHWAAEVCCSKRVSSLVLG